MKMMLNLMHSADCMTCNTTINTYDAGSLKLGYYVMRK